MACIVFSIQVLQLVTHIEITRALDERGGSQCPNVDLGGGDMSCIDFKKWQCYMSLSHILPDIHYQIEQMAFKD